MTIRLCMGLSSSLFNAASRNPRETARFLDIYSLSSFIFPPSSTPTDSSPTASFHDFRSSNRVFYCPDPDSSLCFRFVCNSVAASYFHCFSAVSLDFTLYLPLCVQWTIPTRSFAPPICALGGCRWETAVFPRFAVVLIVQTYISCCLLFSLENLWNWGTDCPPQTD